MAKTLQFRRYNAATIAVTTGAIGELIVNTDANTITVHDGVTSGGWPTPTLYYTQAAFAQANLTAGGLATTNANTIFLSGALATTNANTIFLSGALATTNANTIFLRGALATTNANTIFLSGALTTANANIVAVQALANTDYTLLSAAAGVYGNSTFIPVITLSANGRVSSIVNTAITVGYTTGNGGLITQTSTRSTGVTLNKPSGQITLTSNAMAIGTSNTFTFTNSFISANDFIMFNHWSGGTIGNYVINSNTGVGIANVTIRSIATVAAEAPVLQYVVIKGAAS
jgi:Major tropism determinant N-terminal domain